MVKQFKDGKKKVLFAFAGEVLKSTENRANMKIAMEILEKILK